MKWDKVVLGNDLSSIYKIYNFSMYYDAKNTFLIVNKKVDYAL